MTEGGKKIREDLSPARTSPFAPLRPLLKSNEQDVSEGLRKFAEALGSYETPVRLHVRLLDNETVDHWQVESGAGKPVARRKALAKSGARAKALRSADVLVVVHRDTWLDIARGRLSPFDALAQGRLRVGGDLELAKNIVKHLSDPAVPFVPPC